MVNFLKENIWLVIFAVLAVIVGIIEVLDNRKNILTKIKSKVLTFVLALVFLAFFVLLVLFDFNVI